MLADAVEAVIGAVFLDGGYAAAGKVVRALLADRLAALVGDLDASGPTTPVLAARMGNWKTAVQELLQHLSLQPPLYELLAHDEATPEQRFTVRASVQGHASWSAEGAGPSKKVAEYAAAEQLFALVLRDTPGLHPDWYSVV